MNDKTIQPLYRLPSGDWIDLRDVTAVAAHAGSKYGEYFTQPSVQVTMGLHIDRSVFELGYGRGPTCHWCRFETDQQAFAARDVIAVAVNESRAQPEGAK